MLPLTRTVRTALIIACLCSLAIVLLPNYTEPLWSWAKFVSGSVGKDPLPSFGETQHWSGLALAAFVVSGIAYNLWRDRRFRGLQAEYAYRTGATHLKEKLGEVEAQLQRATQDRDKWQEAYLGLMKQHAAALIASKEHEVRSEYGRVDREALGELRKDFDSLVRSKGHIEGFREAMHFFLTNMSEPDQMAEYTVKPAPQAHAKPTQGPDRRASLPFMSPTT
jgi:hypothetical protein